MISWETRGDVSLRATRFGTQSGRPLLLLNGLTQDQMAWTSLALNLSPSRPVYTLDLPGQGKSSNPYSGMSLVSLAEDVAGFMAAQSEPSGWDIAGFSFGGQVLLELMRDYPDTIHNAVLIGVSPRETLPRRLIVEAWQRLVAAGDYDTMFRVSGAVIYGDAFLKTQEPLFEGMIRKMHRRNSPERILPLIDMVLASRDADEVIASWPPERLALIRGIDDLLLTHSQLERVRSTNPKATFVEIPNSGHTVAVEQPAAFEEAIRRFLES